LPELKNLFITGTSRGIGRSLVEHYCARGHRVFGCSRADSDFQHDHYHHIVADITDEKAVRQLFTEAKTHKASVDVLINNAGLTHDALALMTNTNNARRIVDTNLIGTFILIRETIRYMKRQKSGRIINFSSINVALNSVGSAVYNASKAAVENLTGTIANELADDDITINTIGLSLVEASGMYKNLTESALAEKQRALIKKNMLSISEIAHTIDFLVSDQAKNITNQTIYFGGVK